MLFSYFLPLVVKTIFPTPVLKTPHPDMNGDPSTSIDSAAASAVLLRDIWWVLLG
ncbi:Hypothetical protein P9303_20391 [Prochlorococcus marinus str. MIT 9303]|uniref:Uncharacterized protein n=1 Tax=Prochlorococcus marinus (strain MIT 9303) TaxID=59922 RepID=A2CBB9_PROM3|nr:Hypothetical protein P9303_20391 [Prochlorococcus marinus str. MIT 9303]